MSRQGKLAKKARAQSKRVMIFISLFIVRYIEQTASGCSLPDLRFFLDP
jgi:hypothetical protein